MAALATVAQLRAFLNEGTTPLDADPAALLMLQIASGMVRDYLQQDISQTIGDVVELDPINGYLLLPDLPVTDVTLVESFDGTVWTTITADQYSVAKRLGMISLLPGFTTWPALPGSFRVTYTHGYAVIPDSVIGVVLGVAARSWASPMAVESERIGGYQVKYAMESAGFSPLERIALDRYRVARIS